MQTSEIGEASAETCNIADAEVYPELWVMTFGLGEAEA